jgi:serine phosphatase RsbU (regulator of sigma subunit)
MAEVKGIFETLSNLISSPAEVLIRANEILMNSLERKSFVTAIYGVLNKNTGKVKFARAGHTPLLHVKDSNYERLTPVGMGLGLDNSGSFSDTIKEMEIQLKYNDILALYTDGIPESTNAEMDDFGYCRFENLVFENRIHDLDKISNEIMKDVTTFSQSNIQHDDITLVLIKWKFNNKSLE